MAGRPRGVDDAVILRATAEVIGQVGPAGLTLAAVAREVGVVPGTLVQRFGSKRGLLLALAEQSAKDAATPTERDGQGSALAALRELAVRSMAPMDTPERFANHLAFLCVDLTDPEFHRHALAVHEAQHAAITTLLAQAVAVGELAPGTDVAALSRTVQAVIGGTGLSWALDRAGTLPQRIEQEIDAVVSPHLPARQEDA